MVKKQFILCHCAYRHLLSADVHAPFRDALQEAGVEIVDVPDLCEATAKRDEKLLKAAASAGLAVAACHPRAARWLLEAAGIDTQRVDFFNLRTGTQDSLLAQLGAAPDGEGDKAAEKPPALETGAWTPWFPVIDYDRCTNCGQCLDFCLFSVYERDKNQKVTVTRPENCKTDCPACARICPHSAIMFPKFDEAPINGEPVTDEDAEKVRITRSVQEILGDDPYAALKKRSSQKKLFRPGALEKALAEKAKWIKKQKTD